MIAGSRVGRLTDLHLHLYPHITSLTDHHSFPYLANFMVVGSRVGIIELSFPVFCDITLAPKNSVNYNSTPGSSNSQASLYPGSPKVSKHLSLPSIPATLMPFPMHINYALISDNSPHRFEKIGMDKQKPRGHLPLKRIKPRFTQKPRGHLPLICIKS